jgi:tetratricopeptide (TPR) repeat protein
MARDLKADLQILSDVRAFLENRDYGRAAALAESTLASGFEHPLLLNALAMRLEREDRPEDALRLLERAVAISPGDAGVRHAFSLCLQRLDRPVEALRNIDELLAKHPDLAFAHATRGNALMYLGRPTQAGRSHLRALEIEPGNLVALSALSSLATQRGEYEGARRWAQAARLVSPTHPQALTSLAAAELANGGVTSAESLLEQVILGSHATPVERARATGLLGDVLQAQGRYAEAFNAYTTCNETLRTIYHRLARRTGALAQIRALIASANSIGIAQAQSIPEASAAPVELRGHVFVLDFPGSGKTPLERLLESHPRVSTIDEHELPEREEDCRLPELRTAYWNAVADLGIETAGKVLVDRHPLNTLQWPLIARLFPRAKILFVCRDPRQAVLDCFRYGFAKNVQLYDLLTLSGAAVFYEAAMRFIDRVGPQLGLDWHVLRPEIVDSGLEEGSRAMFDFLGLDRLVDLNDSVGTGQLPGSWTYYEAHLQAIFPAIKTWVGSLGYRL